jgi:hypothetical protein
MEIHHNFINTKPPLWYDSLRRKVSVQPYPSMSYRQSEYIETEIPLGYLPIRPD